MQDNSDAQYRSFRNNIPALLGLSTLSLVAGALYARLWNFNSRVSSLTPRVPFLFTFSVLTICALHGASALKVFGILAVNYSIAKISGNSKANPVLTWAFNLAVLFCNEIYDGYRFAHIHPSLAPLVHRSFNVCYLALITSTLG